MGIIPVPYWDLYRKMVLIREIDGAVADSYPEQRMRCPVHLSVGQEAVSAGVGAALSRGDVMLGTHRSHGSYLAVGGNVDTMLAEMHGKATGCCGGRGGSMHLTDFDAGFWGAIPIVGSAIPITTGAAFAFTMRGEKRVAAIIIGEGATEEGVFHESVQFAALKKLPVVYVCENNGFAVNTPLPERRPPGVSIARLAEAHGLAVAQGDGNDAEFVYVTCREAVERARAGGGASFLEFSTYRWLEHCGPNDDHHLSCRNPADFAFWKKRCPIELFEKKMLAMGLATEAELEEVRKTTAAEAREAIVRAENAPLPDASDAGKMVYADRGAFSGMDRDA